MGQGADRDEVDPGGGDLGDVGEGDAARRLELDPALAAASRAALSRPEHRGVHVVEQEPARPAATASATSSGSLHSASIGRPG